VTKTDKKANPWVISLPFIRVYWWEVLPALKQGLMSPGSRTRLAGKDCSPCNDFPDIQDPTASIRRYGKRLLAKNRGYHGWGRPSLELVRM